jgi:hypothetical protein
VLDCIKDILNQSYMRVISGFLFCSVVLLALTVNKSNSSGCPEGTMKIPKSNICIEKLNPSRLWNFKAMAMYCLSRNLDICLAEQIVKACEEGTIKLPSNMDFVTFLTSSGMFVNITQDCDVAKTGPIGSKENQMFLCCANLSE